MLEYLVNFGVQPQQVELNHDLDVVDKQVLEEQVNTVRHKFQDLVKLQDQVQQQYLQVSSDMRKRKKELQQLVQSGELDLNKADALAQDDDYLELQDDEQALKAALHLLDQQLDFLKQDLRMLHSVFYAKF